MRKQGRYLIGTQSLGYKRLIKKRDDVDYKI